MIAKQLALDIPSLGGATLKAELLDAYTTLDLNGYAIILEFEMALNFVLPE